MRGMAYFLSGGNWLAFFAMGFVLSALGWLGSTLLLKRLAEHDAQTPRQRRRSRRKLGSFSVAAVLLDERS